MKLAAPADTGNLGGAPWPSPDDLSEMQASDYVLHASAGRLHRVPVVKSTLPHDPLGHPQMIHAARAPDGAIYVNQGSLMCRTEDEGRTWTAYPRGDAAGRRPSPILGADMYPYNGPFAILDDGTFVLVGSNDGIRTDPIEIMGSADQGRTWSVHSRLALPPRYDERYFHSLQLIGGRTLLLLYCCRDRLIWEPPASGVMHLLAFRSSDGGHTWSEPFLVCDWGTEGAVAELGGGRLLAVVRYQRPRMPDDTAEDLEPQGARGDLAWKHVFLVDSMDGGRTWGNLRQLTTIFGQCFGAPAVAGDGTIAVVHDTRYGPGPPSGRVMLSRDGGETWADEAVYLYYGSAVSGFSASVTLDDGDVLSIVGTCDHEPARTVWDAAIGHTQVTAIRWNPGKLPSHPVEHPLEEVERE